VWAASAGVCPWTSLFCVKSISRAIRQPLHRRCNTTSSFCGFRSITPDHHGYDTTLTCPRSLRSSTTHARLWGMAMSVTAWDTGKIGAHISCVLFNKQRFKGPASEAQDDIFYKLKPSQKLVYVLLLACILIQHFIAAHGSYGCTRQLSRRE
jgi:hypothetical protein